MVAGGGSGFGGGDQVVTTVYKADTTQQKKALDDLANKTDKAAKGMTRGITNFRDGLFRVFRVLARVRTAFFILVTFLGIRQIGRFLQSLSTFSADFAMKMGEAGMRWEQLRNTIGKMLENVFSDFVHDALDDLERLDAAMSQFADERMAAQGYATHRIVYEGEGRGIIDFAERFGDLIRAAAAATMSLVGAALALVEGVLVPLVMIMKPFIELVLTGFKLIGHILLELLGQLAFNLGDTWFGKLIGGDALNSLKRFMQYKPPKGSAAAAMFDQRGGGYGGYLRQKWGRELSGRMKSYGKDEHTALTATGRMSMSTAAVELFAGFADDQMKALDDALDTLKTSGWWLAFAAEAGDIAWHAMGNMFKRKGGTSGGRAAAINSLEGLVEGLRAGLQKVGAIKSLQTLGQTMGEAIAGGINKGLSDAWLAVMTGKFDDLKEAAKSTLEAINRAIADFIGNMIFQRMVNPWLQSFFSGMFSPAAPLIGPPVPAAPTGQIGPRLESGNFITRDGGGAGVNIVLAPQVIDGPSFSAWLVKEQDTIGNIMVEAVRGRSSQVREAFRK